MSEVQESTISESSLPKKSLKESLGEILAKKWDQIVVDVGSGGYVSTVAEKGTLLILVDPVMEADMKKLDWGENYREKGSAVLVVQSEVGKIKNLLKGKVDRVQMIAPDPDDFWEMMVDSEDMVKSGGELVVVFDLTSNKKQEVAQKLHFLEWAQFTQFEKEIFEPGEIDVDEVVGGSVNSHFINGPAAVVILTRK